MDKLDELLPGIEEFLTNTLATEALSKFAEERRQYFLERLDIANLPPSVPPREGRVLPPELLKETEESSGIPVGPCVPDFAATQREISRSFIDHVTEGDAGDVQKEVKVYDDIDQGGRRCQDVRRQRSASEHNHRRHVDNSKDDDSDNENGLYEVPVSQQFSVDDSSVSYGADGSSLTATGSIEELTHESQDTTASSSTGIPPPLPARKDRSFSDSQSRSSVNDDDDKPPDLPYRPPLPKRSEIYTRSDKSDRSETEKSFTSDPELSGDGDSTSYESFDEDLDLRDTDVTTKYDVKLPKKPKKKTKLRRSAKIRKTKYAFQWEMDVPFKRLDSIDISGELFDKGKLKWNRRIVAISNGHLIVYKPEKDARPSLVIPLTGYEANVSEREGKKGYEVRLMHADGESHTFWLDLKEWAHLWTEHINGHAKGQPPPKYHTHLASSFNESGDFCHNLPTYGSKRKPRVDSSVKFDKTRMTLIGNLENGSVGDEINLGSIKSNLPDSSSHQGAKIRGKEYPGMSQEASMNSLHGILIGRSLKETVKNILPGSQKGVYKLHTPVSSRYTGRYTPLDISSKSFGQQTDHGTVSRLPTAPSSPVCVPELACKQMSLNPDQVIPAFRANDLTGSDVSVPTDTGIDETTKDIGKRKKVTRMGSFAFRATQFLENIGKKTPGRKKTSQPSSSCRHSTGDTTDPSTKRFHLAVSSSGSAGSLARELVSPTSDGSMTSVFGDNSASSLPPTPSDASGSVRNPWETDSSTDCVEIACKGHLSIFSNFNKRCWGKRWCLVRANIFECYKNEHSHQCELSFPLKGCLLRRAVSETNSENGLMLLEADKERITIEPLSKPEMGQWVRTLLKETTTELIPEGLKVFLEDEDRSRIIGPTDIDRTISSHEYEDPEETLAVVAQLEANYQTKQELTVPSNADQNANILPDSGQMVNHVPDSTTLSYKWNQTTDSGFYSVKETNSDSDSSSGNGCVEDKMDGGYSTVYSPKSHNSSNSEHSPKKTSISPKHTVKGCSFPQVLVNTNQQHATSSSYGLHKSTTSTRSSTPSKDHSNKSPRSTISQQRSHHQLPTSIGSSADFGTTDSVSHSKMAEFQTQHSDSASPATKSAGTRRPSQTVVSPSGEEYSIILKRSERESISHRSSAELGDLPVTSHPTSRTTKKTEIDKCIERDKNKVKKNSVDAIKDPISDSLKKSLYRDPVISKSVMKTKGLVETKKPHTPEGHNPNRRKQHHVIVDSSTDQPPPLPKSPIPGFHRNIGRFSKSIPTTQQTLETPASTGCVAYTPDKQRPVSTGGVAYTSEKQTPLSTGGVANTSVKQTPVSTGGVAYTSDKQTAVSTDGVAYTSEKQTPVCSASNEEEHDSIHNVQESWAHLISIPSTTTEEIKTAIDSFKTKQVEIKRKRMAVHDKRQRVLSDEERLACEKEFAALEKLGESTDHTIRTLQNHLDNIQGHTLGAVKTTPTRQMSDSTDLRKTGKYNY